MDLSRLTSRQLNIAVAATEFLRVGYAIYSDDVSNSRRSDVAAAITRHRASTSMYSLTFCVPVMLSECHQWKPAVQAAAVMLRTPPRRRPVTGQPATPTSHIRRAILRTPPVTRWSAASSVRTPRRAFALCRYIAGWTQACN